MIKIFYLLLFTGYLFASDTNYICFLKDVSVNAKSSFLQDIKKAYNIQDKNTGFESPIGEMKKRFVHSTDGKTVTYFPNSPRPIILKRYTGKNPWKGFEVYLGNQVAYLFRRDEAKSPQGWTVLSTKNILIPNVLFPNTILEYKCVEGH